ncbi:hypothetical protein [Streptomyces sp. NPDC002491]
MAALQATAADHARPARAKAQISVVQYDSPGRDIRTDLYQGRRVTCGTTITTPPPCATTAAASSTTSPGARAAPVFRGSAFPCSATVPSGPPYGWGWQAPGDAAHPDTVAALDVLAMMQFAAVADEHA